MWFEAFGRQQNWKLKGHNWSNQKFQNVFLLMSSICLTELRASDVIEFIWAKLILSSFKDPPSASDQWSGKVKSHKKIAWKL